MHILHVIYICRGELEEYMSLLVSKFNPTTVDNLMCKDLVSVDHRGNIFDCDFNQQLGLSITKSSG
jgi:hypothetical protein